MDRFFALFGKIALVILIVGILVGSGIYLGEHLGKKSSTATSTRLINPQSTEATQMPNPTATPTQEPSHFVVEAGGIKPFESYTLSAIIGWTLSKNNNSGMDQVILTKGDYQLSILQAALGGGGCDFSGGAQDMSVQLTNPIDIPLQEGLPLRRGTAQSPTTGKMAFTICQKGSSGSYGTVTEFGVINYSTPLNPSTDMLAQLDGMVGSLQKQ